VRYPTASVAATGIGDSSTAAVMTTDGPDTIWTFTYKLPVIYGYGHPLNPAVLGA
jgi:hypothetical protein